jgi:hypothetical protein
MALPLLRKQYKDIDWDAKFARLGINPQARPETIEPAKMLELFAPENEQI